MKARIPLPGNTCDQPYPGAPVGQCGGRFRASRPGGFGAAADATAAHLPDGRRATLEVAGHVADPAVLAPMLADFYTDVADRG